MSDYCQPGVYITFFTSVLITLLHLLTACYAGMMTVILSRVKQQNFNLVSDLVYVAVILLCTDLWTLQKPAIWYYQNIGCGSLSRL